MILLDRVLISKLNVFTGSNDVVLRRVQALCCVFPFVSKSIVLFIVNCLNQIKSNEARFFLQMKPDPIGTKYHAPGWPLTMA